MRKENFVRKRHKIEGYGYDFTSRIHSRAFELTSARNLHLFLQCLLQKRGNLLLKVMLEYVL